MIYDDMTMQGARQVQLCNFLYMQEVIPSVGDVVIVATYGRQSLWQPAALHGITEMLYAVMW